MAEYELARVGVDPVICAITAGKLKVLLQKREKPPFKGRYELPGGLVRHGETAEQALQRKLGDVLGLPGTYFAQFGTFTAPARDPRARTVSIGFVALVPEHRLGSGQAWHDIREMPPLAFDHQDIILAAHRWLQEHIGSGAVRHFLPGHFALNRLQEVHEVVMGGHYDNRNFRRQMLAGGIVQETREREQGVSHRPAVLYRFRK
jgi:8-oxo-dGTP diphosphatase